MRAAYRTTFSARGGLVTGGTLTLEPGRAYALGLIRDARHRAAAAAPAVAQWLRWLENRELRGGSIDQYERRVAHLLRLYPRTSLDAFTAQDLDVALSRLKPRARREHITAYRSFFRDWAYNRDLIPKDITKQLGVLRGRKQRYSETFTEPEVEALLGLPGEDGMKMTLMLDTGLRISELCHLQVRHVQVDRGRLVVLDGKGGQDRVIPLTQRLIQAFADWQLVEAASPADYVYGHRKSGPKPGISHRRTPLAPDSLRNWFYAACDQAGVTRTTRGPDGAEKRLHPHTTRHTLATTLLRRGAPVERVQKILGHKSIQTTVDQYAHLVVEDLRGVVELLETNV